MAALHERPIRAAVAQRAAGLRVPVSIGSPVLESVMPVIERSRHVRTDVAKLVEHAGWMAYEELPLPEMSLPFGLGQTIEEAIDFVMVSTTINTAFTDFRTAVKFEVEFQDRRWSDSDAMVACLKRGLDAGRPILDGAYLAKLDRATLADIFRGNIEMPMLDEKLRVLREVGGTLVGRYDGHFHRFVRSGPPRLYAGGKGLIERLVAEFPRFNDVSIYDGREVKLFKLAQLGYWGLYSARYKTKDFPLEDASTLTAFADYILPVALRVMNIFVYTPALERAINEHRLIPRDSAEEIELRAHTVYATALMCEEVNKLRPRDMAVIIPQIDARLWTHYHKTFWPHHLTETIMY
jgi:hypothetical protein